MMLEEEVDLAKTILYCEEWTGVIHGKAVVGCEGWWRDPGVGK